MLCPTCLKLMHDVRCPEAPETEPAECECGSTENLFQLGCAAVCKDCLVESMFENIRNAEVIEALRLYVTSDPNAADWFAEYWEEKKIGGTLG